MACPKCGGAKREPLAPGYWRCTSPVIVTTEHGGPGYYGFAGPGVIFREQEVPCGEKYQEGGNGTVECRCGTFAVGRCAECRDPVCGEHSRMVAGRRLCVRHAAVIARRIAEQTARTADAVAGERIRLLMWDWNVWLEGVRGVLAQMDEPVERIVYAVASCQGSEIEWLPPVLIPRDWPEEANWANRWDHDAVQEWFLREVKRAPEQIECSHWRPPRLPFGGRGKLKRWTEPGWTFSDGGEHLGPPRPTGTVRMVQVFASGRRFPADNGFNAMALRLMAEWTELPLPTRRAQYLEADAAMIRDRFLSGL